MNAWLLTLVLPQLLSLSLFTSFLNLRVSTVVPVVPPVPGDSGRGKQWAWLPDCSGGHVNSTMQYALSDKSCYTPILCPVFRFICRTYTVNPLTRRWFLLICITRRREWLVALCQTDSLNLQMMFSPNIHYIHIFIIFFSLFLHQIQTPSCSQNPVQRCLLNDALINFSETSVFWADAVIADKRDRVFDCAGRWKQPHEEFRVHYQSQGYFRGRSEKRRMRGRRRGRRWNGDSGDKQILMSNDPFASSAAWERGTSIKLIWGSSHFEGGFSWLRWNGEQNTDSLNTSAQYHANTLSAPPRGYS